jgi:predicted nuclease of predicted toxin-antitoxin system
MSLRLFCDQCVPAEITNSLRLLGHEVTLLREVLPVRSPDSSVIAKALEMRAVLVSLNGDFSDIVAYPPQLYGGILSVQLHNHPETIPQVMEKLARFLEVNSAQDFYHGKLIIIETHRIRVRQ